MTIYPFNVKRLINICRQNDVSMIGVFGSMARGEAKKRSDIDLIVRFPSEKVYWQSCAWNGNFLKLSAVRWIY